MFRVQFKAKRLKVFLINNILLSAVNGEVPPPLLDLWEIQYFDVDTPLLRDSWREVTKANLWLHMPKVSLLEKQHF